MVEQKTKHGGNRKIGRNKSKCNQYRMLHIREKHKLKKILESSGKEEATKYAKEKNMLSYLNTLLGPDIDT